MMEMTDMEHRLIELENVAEACLKAMTLIPMNALERGYNWMPSAEAMTIIRVAKDRLNDYARVHWGTM